MARARCVSVYDLLLCKVTYHSLSSCVLSVCVYSSGARATTLVVQSLPPKTVASLQATTASLVDKDSSPLYTVPPSTVANISPAPSLTVVSGTVTSVPSLQVRTEHISTVKSLDVKPPQPTQLQSQPRVSAIERIAAQLQANKVKTEAVSTTGLTDTSPTRRSPDTGTQCLPPNEPQAYRNGGGGTGNIQATTNGGSFVTTQTISKVNVPPTGTGSVTATPTSYTTAVTTTASTTTATAHQDVTTVLGKRPRKASTKYEDLEQPATPVCSLVVWFENLSTPLSILTP